MEITLWIAKETGHCPHLTVATNLDVSYLGNSLFFQIWVVCYVIFLVRSIEARQVLDCAIKCNIDQRVIF